MRNLFSRVSYDISTNYKENLFLTSEIDSVLNKSIKKVYYVFLWFSIMFFPNHNVTFYFRFLTITLLIFISPA